MSTPGAPPAGWLLDPDDPTLLRWWDGSAWGEFRRPREAPPAAPPPSGTSAPGDAPARPSLTKPSSPPPSPPDPEPAPAPTPAPAPDEPRPPFTPPLQPFTPSTPPPAPPSTPSAPAPPAPLPPTVPPAGSFVTQWDSAVTAALAAVPDHDRARRAELFAAIRSRVIATAAGDEDVFELFAVTLHDVDPTTGGPAGSQGPADLFVTSRRGLAVAEPTRPGGLVVEIALADVVRVSPVGSGAVRIDLGHAPPVVVRSPGPGRRGDDLGVLLTTLTR